MTQESEALDEPVLSPASSSFLRKLLHQLPDLRECARMERITGIEGWHLLVERPSPSGDADRGLVIWMDKGDDVSVGFGGWHTHAGWRNARDAPVDDEAAMLHLIEGILADRFVLLQDARDSNPERADLIDLQDPDALIDELTAEWSSGRARILTWTGRGDRDVNLQDVKLD
jgi:hypothetical protein